MKRSLNTQVSSVLRIVRGERDALVRTTHFKATVENVSNVTIERKIMSTKTTFKRVALVAVAAVGLGLLTAVPSNAAAGTFTNGGSGLGILTSSTAAQTQAIGGNASVVLLLDTPTAGDRITNVSISGVGTVLSTTLAAATRLYGTAATSNPTSWTDSSSAIVASQTDTILVRSDVVGTTTITATPLDASGTSLTPVTKTITWTAVAATAVVNHSTAYINAGVTANAAFADDSTAISVPSTSSATAVAVINVDQYLTADTTTVVSAANSSAVSVAITGAGSVGLTQATAGPSVSTAAGSFTSSQAAGVDYSVFANGVAGVGTIKISVAGVVIATKTVTFYGALASYVVTPSTTSVGIGESSATLTVTGLDSLGNAAPVGTVYATSGTTANATVPATATVVTTLKGTVAVTGVAAGTSVITLANAASSATITATNTVTVSKTSAKTVTFAFDKASYAPGEKITLTVAAVDSNGAAVADGTRTLLSGVATSNVSLQGTYPTAAMALVGGSATFTLYAPLLAGDVTVSSTEGTGTDNVAAAGTAAAITAGFTVSGGDAAAALDAANEATDAANYAADAADAATTAAEEATAAANAAGDAATAAQASADAALAAVTDLGLKVTGLISALRAQITSLTNLIVKIQKKVNA